MKEIEEKVLESIGADSLEEFQKLYNSTAKKLKAYSPRVEKYLWNNQRCADFEYTITHKVAENLTDDFMQHHERCTCSDCPFMEIGTDARRRWHPCQYASNGETRIDSEACDVFYKEAVRMMRDKAGRS